MLVARSIVPGKSLHHRETACHSQPNYREAIARHEKAIGSFKDFVSSGVDDRRKKLTQIQQTVRSIAVQEIKDVDDAVRNILPLPGRPRSKINQDVAYDDEKEEGVMPEN